MFRVKRGVTSHAKHKKVYKAAKVFTAAARTPSGLRKPRSEKAGQYAFRDRKRKKRTFPRAVDPALNAAKYVRLA